MTIEDFRLTRTMEPNSTAESQERGEMEISERDRLDQITRRIIGVAIEVHRHLGPGLLESAYETCSVSELKQLGFRGRAAKAVTRRLQGDRAGLRLSPRFGRRGFGHCGTESSRATGPIFEAQLLSYLRLTGQKVGLLINFHVAVLKNGIKRPVNEFPDDKTFSASSASRR